MSDSIKQLIANLKSRVQEFRHKRNYDTLHPSVKHDVNAIEICINLIEIKFYYRELRKEELRWFEGSRSIEETFGEEWKDIAIGYKHLVNIAIPNSIIV